MKSAVESLKAESGKQHVWVPPSPCHHAYHFLCFFSFLITSLLYPGIVHGNILNEFTKHPHFRLRVTSYIKSLGNHIQPYVYVV